MSEASDTLIRVIEYLSARGNLMKHEAHELLGKTDCRKEGERHVKAATLLIAAQNTLAICSELAEGAHLKSSTSWEIRCRTCNKKGGIYNEIQNDYGRNLARRVIGEKVPLTALARSSLSKHVTEIEIDIARVDLRFFAEHGDHDLVPHDEYGRDDNQCQKWVKCSMGHDHQCKRPENHKGSCGNRIKGDDPV